MIEYYGLYKGLMLQFAISIKEKSSYMLFGRYIII